MTRLALLVLALALLAPASAWAQTAPEPPVASAVHLTHDAGRTRLMIELSAPVDVRAFTLADPLRVVVDTAEITFRLPASAGRDGRGLVSAYRFGRFAQGRSRLVVDLAEPAVIERAVAESGRGGHRLILDLKPTTRAAFMAALGPPAQAAARPSEPARRPGAADELPLIVLDPGHGGIDSGAVAFDGTTEKAIVLGFAQTLKQVLERTGRVRVALTREGDSFVSLSERVRFARERQAALLVSIHADSLRGAAQNVRGSTLYTLSETASDREAEALAERENRSDLIAGIDLTQETDEVADILVDLTRRETQNFSVRFARIAVRELGASVRLARNPHRFAGFRVLRAHDVPSALLELGFLSSREDVRAITSEEWRRSASEAMARAIIGFATREAVIAAPPTAAR